MIKRSVFCSLQFVAFHRWPDAPENVDYLRNTHRHVFKVAVTAEVQHDNRDIEFITLKEMVQDYVDRQFAGKDLGRMSCEDIAHDILDHFSMLDKVSIAEDGENGATLWRV